MMRRVSPEGAFVSDWEPRRSSVSHRYRARGQRLRNAFGDVFFKSGFVGSCAAADEDEYHEDVEQCTHVHPPMKGSASVAVSRNAFMMSTKNAPDSGTIR